MIIEKIVYNQVYDKKELKEKAELDKIKKKAEEAQKKFKESGEQIDFNKIEEMFEYYVPKFELKGVKAPSAVAFRTMSSRWGVCSPSTGKITFNYNLFEAPEELIAYIVVHEMAHFLEPNHSERFWAHVGDVMPDYKARRKLLREY